MSLNQFSMKFRILAGTAGFLVILSLVLTMWQKSTPLVVVDINRAIQVPSATLARSKMTPDAQLKIMGRFSTLLPKIIKEYGETHRVTIINATVLASNNTHDITDTIIALTIERMKHEA